MGELLAERVEGGSCGKVKCDIHTLLATDVCNIERAICPILLETKKKWWDMACEECEKTRPEQRAEIDPWTRHILQLKFELEKSRIPYGVDDLSPDEWNFLGIVNQEVEIVEAEQRRKKEKQVPRFHPSFFPSG